MNKKLIGAIAIASFLMAGGGIFLTAHTKSKATTFNFKKGWAMK